MPRVTLTHLEPPWAGGHDFETSLQRLGYDANCAAAAFRDLDRQNAGGTNTHYLQSGGHQGKAVTNKNWDSRIRCKIDHF